MDPSLRTRKALHERIDKMQTECIRRFQNLVALAAVNQTDRTVTAGVQLQMRTETAALIHSFEDIQTLIRELQQLWLQGTLNTLSDSKAKESTNETASAVADALRILTGMQQAQQAQQQQGQAAPAG